MSLFSLFVKVSIYFFDSSFKLIIILCKCPIFSIPKSFLIISSVRIFGEVLIEKGAINLFDADFHYGPIVRLLEFYMGKNTPTRQEFIINNLAIESIKN